MSVILTDVLHRCIMPLSNGEGERACETGKGTDGGAGGPAAAEDQKVFGARTAGADGGAAVPGAVGGGYL